MKPNKIQVSDHRRSVLNHGVGYLWQVSCFGFRILNELSNYILQGECEKRRQDMVQRLFDIIEDISIDTLGRSNNECSGHFKLENKYF